MPGKFSPKVSSGTHNNAHTLKNVYNFTFIWFTVVGGAHACSRRQTMVFPRCFDKRKGCWEFGEKSSWSPAAKGFVEGAPTADCGGWGARQTMAREHRKDRVFVSVPQMIFAIVQTESCRSWGGWERLRKKCAHQCDVSTRDVANVSSCVWRFFLFPIFLMLNSFNSIGNANIFFHCDMKGQLNTQVLWNKWRNRNHADLSMWLKLPGSLARCLAEPTQLYTLELQHISTRIYKSPSIARTTHFVILDDAKRKEKQHEV